MSMVSREAIYRESAAYGGMIDAIGGIATIVLAVVGLAGVHPPALTAIATIVFGIALLIQGGAMLSEYAEIVFGMRAKGSAPEKLGGSSLFAVFLVGSTGVVLGVLGVLGIHTAVLLPIAAIAYGAALVLSSEAVWNLYTLRRASALSEGQPEFTGGRILAREMASVSAGVQGVTGVIAIVLGVLAVAGAADFTLTLVALLALGGALVMTGSSLSAMVVGLGEQPAARALPR